MIKARFKIPGGGENDDAQSEVPQIDEEKPQEEQNREQQKNAEIRIVVMISLFCLSSKGKAERKNKSKFHGGFCN